MTLTNLKMWLAAGAVLVLLLGGVWISRLAAENKALTASVKTLTASNHLLKKDLAANQEALTKRTVEKARLTAETKALKARIEEVYKNDKDAKDWGASPCPVAVIDCLRE